MMEQLQQICAQRGINIIDAPELQSDTILLYTPLQIMAVSGGITDATMQAAINLLKGGVPA